MTHLQDLSRYYAYIETRALEISQKVVNWHKDYGNPAIESRYLVETAYRIINSPIYATSTFPSNLDISPISSALIYLDLLEDNYMEFLSGKKTGSEIIRQGQRELWVDFNRGNPLMDIFSDAVAKKVLPYIPNSDVLELGGGVGGTTTKLKDELVEARSFYFTDIKSYFLDNIKEELPHLSINTRILDLKLPPEDFPQFDVIYATNVIHVVTDIERTMKWIYNHLRDNGVIILGEGSPYSRTCPWPLELMFSLFEGWWNILRFDQRPYPGWLLPEQWIRMFSSAGFRETEINIFMDEQRLFGGTYTAQKTDH